MYIFTSSGNQETGGGARIIIQFRTFLIETMCNVIRYLFGCLLKSLQWLAYRQQLQSFPDTPGDIEGVPTLNAVLNAASDGHPSSTDI